MVLFVARRAPTVCIPAVKCCNIGATQGGAGGNGWRTGQWAWNWTKRAVANRNIQTNHNSNTNPDCRHLQHANDFLELIRSAPIGNVEAARTDYGQRCQQE
jgi:hypothetical protein